MSRDHGVTVAGGTLSPDFPTTPSAYDSFPTTLGAFDTTPNGRTDVFASRFSPDGSALLYSTFLGGTQDDYVRGVALGPAEHAIIVGETRSPDFPTTPGAFGTSYDGGLEDGFVVRLDMTPEALIAISAVALNSPVPRGEPLRFEVTLTNLTPSPLTGDLTLDIAGPDGATYFRLLEDDRTLGAGTTRTPEYVLPVHDDAALGVYTATVTALEGSTTPLGAATFTFEVVSAAQLAGAAGPAGTFGEVESLDAGLGGHASATAQAPGTAAVLSPNPASGRAAVAFALDAPAEVRLVLYDVLGREAAAVQSGHLDAGAHRLSLDVSALPAGVYVWRLAAGERVENGRLTVMR